MNLLKLARLFYGVDVPVVPQPPKQTARSSPPPSIGPLPFETEARKTAGQFAARMRAELQLLAPDAELSTGEGPGEAALALEAEKPMTAMERLKVPNDQLPDRGESGQPQIRVVSGGAGLGHKIPASAQLEYAAASDEVDITYYDVPVGPFIDPSRGKTDDKLYQRSNSNSVYNAFSTTFRRYGPQQQTYEIAKHLTQNPTQTDLWVINHPIIGDAFARALPADARMNLEFTDHGEGHRRWVPKRFKKKDSNDVFITPTEQSYKWAKKLMPAERVVKIPYGVRAEFEKVAASGTRAEVRERLNLPVDKQLVVWSAGGGNQATSYSIEVITALMKHPDAAGLHMVVATGHSQELQVALAKLKEELPDDVKDNLQIEGYCDGTKMAELSYAAGMSDPPSFPAIMAGGGSIADNKAALNAALIYQFKSGVEAGNLDYAAKEDIAFIELTVDEVVKRVYNTTPSEIEAKRVNVDRLHEPGGAKMRADFHIARAKEALKLRQDKIDAERLDQALKPLTKR